MNRVDKALSVLDKLETFGNERNVKIRLLTENASNKKLYRLFKLCYDPYITYGFIPDEFVEVQSTSIFKKRKSDTPQDTLKNFKAFLKILKKLRYRKLTGNAARDTVMGFLSGISTLEAKWYARVLRRDLRLGLRASTINKVWEGAISIYSDFVQKASTYTGQEFDFPVVMEPKFDGFRMLLEVRDSIGVVRSRNGFEYPTLAFLAEKVASLFPNIVLDGEVLSKDWNRTAKLVRKRPENLTASDKKALAKIKLHVFDCVTPEGFRAGFESTTDGVRRNRLTKVCKKLKSVCDNFEIVPRVTVNSTKEIESVLEVFIQEKHEGAILKITTAPYEPINFRDGRTPYWWKLKQFEDVTATIIGIYRGTKKNKDKLGGFHVRTDDGLEFSVGGGFSDRQRKEFLDESLVGARVELVQQKDPGKKVAVTRFPVFSRIRDVDEE